MASLVLLGLIVVFWFLCFILFAVGLVCQYHSQAIGWKDYCKETSLQREYFYHHENMGKECF